MEYIENKGTRRVSDNEFARWLGVSPASFNQWINGNRTPDLENAAKLAKRLGPRVFDVLGYEEVQFIEDPELKFVSRNWKHLDSETRLQIYNHVEEVINEQSKQGGKS
jgi:transcriptional regulator with XRE-family HTH domain